MDQNTRKFILNIMDSAQDMTLATVRPDGYPQATTVTYSHEGLTMYVWIGNESQKAKNIRLNNKVSLTIDVPYDDWNHIKGLSIGGIAELVDDPEGVKHAVSCMLKRFPQLADWAASESVGNVVFLKIEPEVISVLDYEKGFGHCELVKVQAADHAGHRPESQVAARSKRVANHSRPSA